MLKYRSVFVLGAGASVAPFAYPTGIELSKRIMSLLQPGSNFHSHLKDDLLRCQLREQDLFQFRSAFFQSGKNSIDAFLEHRTDLTQIGRMIIAATLIGYEIQEKLFSYENNWLRTLYNNLTAPFDAFGDNPISFVTFNYDRVVEQFLFTALQSTYNRTADDCKSILDRIPIIHLHGQLEYLPWQGIGAGRSYSCATSDPASIVSSADKIKIIHEEITDGRDKEFFRAKALIAQAERIFLLGFGFHPLNVSRLGIREFRRNAIATGVGLMSGERGLIASLCEGKVTFAPGDCDQTVREFVE